MSKPGELAHDEIVSRRSERRVVILATSFGFLMFLCLCAFVPGLGPILRVYTNPSGSMMPTIRTGSYSVVSRASYGYSRYSFDSFELPIAGRWPALMPQRGAQGQARCDLPEPRRVVRAAGQGHPAVAAEAHE